MSVTPALDRICAALAEYDTAITRCPVNFPRENHVSPSKPQDVCSRCGNTASGNCGVESGASYQLIRAVRGAVAAEQVAA